MRNLTLRTKIAVVRVLCQPFVGKAIALLFRNRIPSKSRRIFTGDRAVKPQTVASIYWGFYERAELGLARKRLRTDLDLVELGASIGVMAAHLSSRLSRERHYVAVEANPALIPLLNRNFCHARPHNSVVANLAVLSGPEAPPQVDLELGTMTTGSRLMAAHPGQFRARGTTQKIQVRAVSLSQLLLEHKIDEYVLVCDIEGAELSILLHDFEALQRCQQMLIELHSVEDRGRRYSVGDLMALVEGRDGFHLAARDGNVFLYER